jgi:hypothetical protein
MRRRRRRRRGVLFDSCSFYYLYGVPNTDEGLMDA